MARYKPKEGFLMLWRRFRDHRFWPTYEERPFTKAEAWIDLLMDASYRSRKCRCRGRVYNIKEGELVFSARDKARHWRWKRSDMRSFLDELYQNGEALPETADGVTHLSIVKLRPYVDWTAPKNERPPTQLPQEGEGPPKKLRSTKNPSSPTPMKVLVQPWHNWLKKKGSKE